MSKFDWCYNNIWKCNCIDYKNDHCDGCNFFEAYMQGQLDSIDASGWKISKLQDKTNGIKITCLKCGDSQEIDDIGVPVTHANSAEILKNVLFSYKFCRHCGSLMK